MGKKISYNNHNKIYDELVKANIDKELIDNVYRVSQNQIETLKNKIIEDEIPSSVQEVFVNFLKENSNDKF